MTVASCNPGGGMDDGADAATSALIAKLLQEDEGHGGGSAYGRSPYGDPYLDESDDSMDRKRKKKKTAKPKKEPKPKPPPKPKKEKKEKKVKPPEDPNKKRKRGWSDEEEKLFLEALELHGRNWHDCAAHVGTRDKNSFTSHAQKHFIKLHQKGLPLPEKVKESGEGYTLSGKPIDTNGGAYLQYTGQRQRKKKEKEGEVEGGGESNTSCGEALQQATVSNDGKDETQPMQVDAPANNPDANNTSADGAATTNGGDGAAADHVASGEGVEEEKKVTANASSTVAVAGDAATAPEQQMPQQSKVVGSNVLVPSLKASLMADEHLQELDRQRQSKKDKRKKKSDGCDAADGTAASGEKEKEGTTGDREGADGETKGDKVEADAEAVGVDNSVKEECEDGMTDYTRNRPRRRTANNYIMSRTALNPLGMVPCKKFRGAPGSKTVGAQPFKVTVNSNTLLLMDFHAHLATFEIIGFLGGSWDPEKKLLTIADAYPCQSLRCGGADDHVNVEMDPQSELEVREKIQRRNQQIVGWYHSHPAFEPNPSMTDIENQLNYQTLFRDAKNHQEPFVGAIVGTYDMRLPSEVSVMNWFYVDSRADRRGVAMKVEHNVLFDAAVSEDVEGKMNMLIDLYKEDDERVRLDDIWRMKEVEPNRPQGEQLEETSPAAVNEDSTATTTTAASEMKGEVSSVAVTKLVKIARSLRPRLPIDLSPRECTNYLMGLLEGLRNQWNGSPKA